MTRIIKEIDIPALQKIDIPALQKSRTDEDGEIPLPCPICGGEPDISHALAVNPRDPVNGMVTIQLPFMGDPLQIMRVIACDELLHKPTKQGVWLACECDCGAEDMFLQIVFDDDGRTRFYWAYLWVATGDPK
jgi:hypothetical protein